MTAPAIDVKPGDKITSFMQYYPEIYRWVVSGTNVNSGANSTLHIQYEKAGATKYDYAMLVNGASSFCAAAAAAADACHL